jgi:hypothetical protein
MSTQSYRKIAFRSELFARVCFGLGDGREWGRPFGAAAALERSMDSDPLSVIAIAA